MMGTEQFLMKPFQRITKYPLLFRELLKSTRSHRSGECLVEHVVLEGRGLQPIVHKSRKGLVHSTTSTSDLFHSMLC